MVKSVPIKSKVVVNPGPGYLKVGAADIDSSMVRIAGAKNAIQLIESIYTENDTFDNIDLFVNRYVEVGIGQEVNCVECSAFQVESIFPALRLPFFPYKAGPIFLFLVALL